MKELELPIGDNDLSFLEACDRVSLTGETLTMRDAALKRLEAMVAAGERPPFDLAGQLVFHAGPTPARGGRPCGAIGPTTSSRMDRFTGLLMDQEACELHSSNGAVYLVAVGGAGAYLASFVSECAPIAWEDLGPEAVYRVRLERFPALVAVDTRGRDCLSTRHDHYSSQRNNI
jgi:fumarate hydratase subunit beta